MKRRAISILLLPAFIVLSQNEGRAQAPQPDRSKAPPPAQNKTPEAPPPAPPSKAAAAAPPGAAQAAPARPAAQAPPAAGPADAIAQKAVAAAQKENYEEAISLFRDAFRIDHNPRWLYNLAVLHDRLAECDDAAFFYRAALWGKGVLPQDKDAVDNRLGVLEEECHYKARHATQADRHARAARYAAVKMCFLAQSILEGIITPAEKKMIEECYAKEKAAEKK